jgi:putative addiction module killer protein
VKNGDPGDMKLIGHGVWELRLFFGSGYRIYFMTDEKGITLITAGDKATQSNDIALAIKLREQRVGN